MCPVLPEQIALVVSHGQNTGTPINKPKPHPSGIRRSDRPPCKPALPIIHEWGSWLGIFVSRFSVNWLLYLLNDDGRLVFSGGRIHDMRESASP